MPRELFEMLDPAQSNLSTALESFRIEQCHHFEHGYVEIRKYVWRQQVEDVIFIADDVLVLNMALSPRPARTRVTRVKTQAEDPPRDVGRLLIIPPGCHYRLISPSGSLRSIGCALSRRKFETVLQSKIDWEAWSQASELSGPSSEIEGLLGRIYSELRHDRLGREAAIEAYANALCIELARRLRQGRPVRPELHKGGLAPWRMKLLRERIAAAGPAPRITELAELCGLTERQLSRAFKAETGQTIGSFVNTATMERALHLLTATDRSIGEIAAELGFASAATFAQAFRRAINVLPSQVRQR